MLPRYGQGIGVLRSTGFALATRNRLGITSNKRFRLDFIFRILNYTPTPIQLRVVEFLQRLHGDYFTVARTLVGKLDFLHGGVDTAQLILDALAALDGATQQRFHLFGSGLAVRVDEFHQSGERLFDAVLISRGQCGRQFEILFEPVAVIGIAQVVQNLRQIVDHESESAGEHLGTDLFELPTRQVEVDAVQERRIMVLLRQLFEQVGVFQHVRHVMRGVAYERHARLALERLDATGERLVGHVVLHDVHQVPAGLLGLARELVERHRIPIAHKPQVSVGIVHEQFGHCHFPAGYEHAVR